MTLVVNNYDLPIAYFTTMIGFVVVSDKVVFDSKRWVVVRPGCSMEGCGLLLAKAANPEQSAAIGHQASRRVQFFINIDDFAADHARLSNNGIKFCEKPRYDSYGIIAKFHDIFGNTWDLLQRAKNSF